MNRLRHHVFDIAKQHGIRVKVNSGVVNSYPKLVNIPEIDSHYNYALAMHELGHALDHRQSFSNIKEAVWAWKQNEWRDENWAWDWARENALVWTTGMERARCVCLGIWYRHLMRAMFDPPPKRKR